MYRVVIYPEASDQIDELPGHLLLDYVHALDVLAVAPWDGASHNSNNPDAKVPRWLFGPLGVGQVIYLVLEREREVHVLRVVPLDQAAASFTQPLRRSSGEGPPPPLEQTAPRGAPRL